jgi:trimeric autotransporter adhesin
LVTFEDKNAIKLKLLKSSFMKKYFSMLLFVMAVTITMAQSPQKFNYQGVARDNTGKELNNKSIGIRLNLHYLSGGGTVVYQEKHTVTTSNLGLFTVKVGAGTVLSGTFASINWADGPYYIEVEMDPAGGTSYTSMGTSQLISVPYALYAANAGIAMKAGTGITIKGDSIINSAPDRTVKLTGTGGANITGTYPNFNINAPANQTLKYSNDSLYISNGNSVIVKSDRTLALTPSGSITITGSYPNFTIGSSSSSINLIPAGGTVITGTAPNFTINTPWMRNGANLYHLNGGNIGIGLQNPTSRLYIKDTLTNTRTNSLVVDAKGGSTSTSMYRGIYCSIRGTDGNNRAIQGLSIGASALTNIGIAGFADSANTNIGIVGNSYANNNNANGLNFGVNAAASNSIYANIAVGAYATNGTASAMANYGFLGNANSATSSSGTNYGIFATASNGNTNYAGYFDGDVTVTGTFTNPSDLSLKSDVKDLNGALTILNNLHPVSYFYNKEDNKYMKLPDNLQYGFIAQELEKVLPDLVKIQKHPVKTMGGKFGEIDSKLPNEITYKGINYIGLIPVLTKGIQEQQQEINSLKLEIAKLRTEVEKLKSEVSK